MRTQSLLKISTDTDCLRISKISDTEQSEALLNKANFCTAHDITSQIRSKLDF